MGHHHDEHHDHNGHNHHHGNTPSELSFEEKLVRLINHWIEHNNDHCANYRKWAQMSEEAGQERVGGILGKASEKTEEISELFRSAATAVNVGGKESSK